MDMSLMVKELEWSFLVVDVGVGRVVVEEDLVVAVVVVAAAADMEGALLHVALSTVSWYLDCLLLVVGKISRTTCGMLVTFSLLMSSKMALVLWSILIMTT